MFNIIPKPCSIKKTEGKVWISSETVLEGEYSGIYPVIKEMMSGYEPASENRMIFKRDSTLPDEGYRIHCNYGNIEISSSDERGAFYGVMTLLQLAGSGEIDAVEIEDEPKYSFRGFMLDSARHFQSIEKIKKVIDLMARLKMNEFHWHLTDDQGWRVEIKKYPLLTEKGTVRVITEGRDNSGTQHPDHIGETYGEGMFYSQNEIREIVNYASERMIEVIPEFDMPGHLTAAIACYPELYCTEEPIEVSDRWGVHDNIGCVGREEFFSFAENVIDELCELFPGRYFHIGGDEVPKNHWKECPYCQQRIREEGLADEEALQGYFNDRITKYLASKNKIMIGWNEILHTGHPDKKYAVAQWWYDSSTDTEKNWIEGGGRVIVSLASYFYMDHLYAERPLWKTYGFDTSMLGLNDESSVMGMEIPQWTERVATGEKFDLNTYARLIAASEVEWTPAKLRRYEDFEMRLEAMRKYFSDLGINIAVKSIYRGDTLPDGAPEDMEERIKYSRNLWRNDPDYEVRISKVRKD